MKLAVPREQASDENRVAVIPDSIKRLSQKGFEVMIESGAGLSAGYEDQEYTDKGAALVNSRQELFSAAGLLVKIRPPTEEEIDLLPRQATLISIINPMTNHDLVKKLAEKEITSFGLDVIPRTTLAQSMDVLSSMSTISGYKAVIIAAELLPRFFPMLMTAAGTVPPARVLVLGCGVAGLMACATAKRLGGVVEAFDVRAEAREQAQSVGAKFIEVPLEEEGSAGGGYAREMSEEYQKKQAELIAKHIARADVVVPTALIPGKKAPILISEEMVATMKPGSVIVDLAAEMGGNCALTRVGETITAEGVTIVGNTNIPGTMAYHASQMFSKNIEKYLSHLCDGNGFKMDMDDEITAGSLVTHRGDIVHARTREIMQP